ncbi:MAG: hypothetical protein AAF756_20565 [Pseudomonadota bacterium]
MRRVWPFKPRTPILERLDWATDVFRAKSAEQRIALRTQPRRIFLFGHYFPDETSNYARTLIRNAQGESGFWVPDWTQSESVASITAGSGVSIPVDLSVATYGDSALIWESQTKYEVVSVTIGSPETSVTADVTDSYTDALIMPVWRGDAPEGLSVDRQPAHINNAAVSCVLSDDFDISASSYPQYRSIDVMTDRPIVSSGSFSETEAFPVSSLGSAVGDTSYLRQRDVIDFTFQMRWHVFTKPDLYSLRQWLHARKGRQKGFWLSTNAKDLEVSSISGTTVTVFNDILARPSGYDIEVLSGGTKYYRQVTGAVAGSDVGGRPTADLTVDSSLPVSTAERCSYLICSRFDTDRIELTHQAQEGTICAVPCREIPVP